jgi:16S rRNA (cytosine1402-N4)-methyltransferase
MPTAWQRNWEQLASSRLLPHLHMTQHISVLKDEAVCALALKPGAVVVDATFGAGGHARVIINTLQGEGTYIGIDADETAFLNANLPQSKVKQKLVTENFSQIEKVVNDLGYKKVDAILADLGWRLDQFTGGGKGFSFQSEESLLMTYGTPENYTFTASTIANEWEENSIADIIFAYGEERLARKIARAIVLARQIEPIKTNKQLADIIEKVVRRQGKIHPATKTFQALRIAVNDELASLQKLLQDGFELLSKEGTMAIITFHSLEDRIVKQFFKSKVEAELGRLLFKKPVTPSEAEIKSNPRARSAKLRAIKKTS